MKKDYIKITVQDYEIAATFFDNEKHLSEFLLSVFKYYTGQKVEIKTKIVSKYFETYKKTMDFIIDAKKSGKYGASLKAENQVDKEQTLEGYFKGPSRNPSSKYKIVNSKIVNSKIVNRKEENNNNNNYAGKIPLPEYVLCLNFWLKEFHVGWTFGGIQGKALKSLIGKLKSLSPNTTPTPNDLDALFRKFCVSLPDWFKDKDLPVLNSKFNEIVEQIKKGSNGFTKESFAATAKKWA